MDLQSFVDKEFILLDDNMEKKVKEFIDAAFKFDGIYREWVLFSNNMIPVYERFARFFNTSVIEKIIEEFHKEIKKILEENENKEGTASLTLKELDAKTLKDFFLLLKTVYQSEFHNELSGVIEGHIKRIVKKGLHGDGHAGAFWNKLDKIAQQKLQKAILNLWVPSSRASIIRAIRASGEFLKYKTDETVMTELTQRLSYCIFTGSAAVKIEWCRVVETHLKADTPWFKDNRSKILQFLEYFEGERNLELLRRFLKLVPLFKKEELQNTISSLQKNAPYAEIRRVAGQLLAATGEI